MKTMMGYFLKGLLFLIPSVGTGYVLYIMIDKVDALFAHKTYGAGIIVIFVAVSIIGFLGDKLITVPVQNRFEGIIKRMPFIKMIYSSIKEFTSALIGKKKGFDKPVLVKLYKDSEVQRIGFVTDDQIQDLSTIEDEVTVYVPHSFAVSGQLFIVPKHYTTPIEGVSSSDLMKYIMAGGVTKITEK